MLRTGTLVAAILGVVVALTAEALVRLVAPQPQTPLLDGLGPPGLARLDPVYGWTWTPGFRGRGLHDTTVVVNSLGLRDREYGFTADDEVRILSLGDSFAFGTGVELEETYGKLLERMLSARFPAATVSVVNAGVVGWSQHQMIRAVSDLHARLQPDLALATFVAGNDVQENGLFAGRLAQGVKTPLGIVGRHSHVAHLLLKTLFPVTRLVANRSASGIAATVALLRRLEAELATVGLPYVMVVIPARHQVRPEREAWTAALRAIGLGGYLFRQNRAIVAHFVAEGVPYVDPTPALAARDAIDPVMFDDDAHTNPLGHTIIAERIAERMEPMVAEVIARRNAAGR